MISIIIINFNGKEFLKNCLDSIEGQKLDSYEIILVDNNSTDDSIRFVEDNYSSVRLIKNKENLGFSEANNIGYKASKGDYILFINNDIKGGTN